MESIAQASYQGQIVEVTDIFEMGGKKLVTVRALVGKPFVGGDKWPIRTEYATVEASELKVHSLPIPAVKEVEHAS